jgi:hypothetical protein
MTANAPAAANSTALAINQRSRQMQAITMTAEQTKLYRTLPLTGEWNRMRRDLCASARRLSSETGEMVEVYTADGIVVYASYPDEE